MKRSLVILLTAVSISAMTAGTAFPAFAEATEAEAEETTDGAENAADSELEDGVYGVEFDTDSSMFHVNEANDEKGELTVCLLYTSPSPRDLSTSRMPSSA